MKNQAQCVCLFCGLVALLMLSSANLATALSQKERAALDRANADWSGALCRTRVPLEFKKKKKTWVKSKWLYFGERPYCPHVRLEASNGAEVHQAFAGGVIPPGTEFRFAGWNTEGDDLVIELELNAQPLQFKVYFWDYKPGMVFVPKAGVKKLEKVEAWAKTQFLEIISMPSEQLVEVPETQVAEESIGAAVERLPDPTAESVNAESPTITVTAVAVQPPSVTAGGNTNLVISYDVRGVPVGPGFEVLEIRQLRLQGKLIASFENTVQRNNGHHDSMLPMQVPPDTAPGYYRLEARIVMAGRDASGSALFEVITP